MCIPPLLQVLEALTPITQFYFPRAAGDNGETGVGAGSDALTAFEAEARSVPVSSF